jgi:hypothetical protein
VTSHKGRKTGDRPPPSKAPTTRPTLPGPRAGEARNPSPIPSSRAMVPWGMVTQGRNRGARGVEVPNAVPEEVGVRIEVKVNPEAEVPEMGARMAVALLILKDSKVHPVS